MQYLSDMVGVGAVLLVKHRIKAGSMPHAHKPIPADTRRYINVVLTLVNRLRRWTNVTPTLI